MEIKENTDVFTPDGQKVGQISRMVIDPKTKELTHLVVQKGFLFTKNKVVAVDDVQYATEDRVVLKKGCEDPDKFPDFEETHFIEVDATGKSVRRDADKLGPLAWYYPMPGGAWWSTHMGNYPGYGKPPFVRKTTLNIPEGTVPLEEGAKVLSKEGQHVGDVETVYADDAEQRVTHLLIAKGLISKSYRLIPSMWVASVSEEAVRLSVDEPFVENLPEYASRD